MKAAIFDMDGTLLDSMGMWDHLTFALTDERGIAPDEDLLNAHRTLMPNELAQYLIDRFGWSDSAEEILGYWERRLTDGYEHLVTPKPGAVDYLRQLKRQGVGVAVATLTPHYLADGALSAHGLDQFVDVVLTVEDVGGVKKTRPDIFLEAARQLGVAPDDCVVFEDSLYAIETAVKAGLTTWALADPHAQNPDRIRELADRYLIDFTGLVGEQ